jgi:hypothetical protein
MHPQNPRLRKLVLVLLPALWVLPAGSQPWPYAAPPPFAAPTNPSAQRSAADGVRSQVGWVQNACRTASSYGDSGYGTLWQQFQTLRGAYTGFKNTLSPLQLNNGANEIAELDAGLDILQESFNNYQEDVAGGQPTYSALNSLCQVLSQASGVWVQEFNRDCARIGVGQF